MIYSVSEYEAKNLPVLTKITYAPEDGPTYQREKLAFVFRACSVRVAELTLKELEAEGLGDDLGAARAAYSREADKLRILWDFGAIETFFYPSALRNWENLYSFYVQSGGSGKRVMQGFEFRVL